MPPVPISSHCPSPQELRKLSRDGANFSDEDLNREFRYIYHDLCPVGQSVCYIQAQKFFNEMQQSGSIGCRPSLEELKGLVQQTADDTKAMAVTQRTSVHRLEHENRILKQQIKDLIDRSEKVEMQRRELQEAIRVKDDEIKCLKTHVGQGIMWNQSISSRI